MKPLTSGSNTKRANHLLVLVMQFVALPSPGLTACLLSYIPFLCPTTCSKSTTRPSEYAGLCDGSHLVRGCRVLSTCIVCTYTTARLISADLVIKLSRVASIRSSAFPAPLASSAQMCRIPSVFLIINLHVGCFSLVAADEGSYLTSRPRASLACHCRKRSPEKFNASRLLWLLPAYGLAAARLECSCLRCITRANKAGLLTF
jgi:hypothetical protein